MKQKKTVLGFLDWVVTCLNCKGIKGYPGYYHLQTTVYLCIHKSRKIHDICLSELFVIVIGIVTVPTAYK